MFERSTHRKRLEVISEINMTPMMDLTFTLLIVFIITVPIMDYTSDVTPPKMTTPQEVTEQTMANAALVELDEDGNVKVDGNSVPFHELEVYFQGLSAQGKEKIHLYPDKDRHISEMVAIMRAANHTNLAIQLMTQAE